MCKLLKKNLILQSAKVDILNKGYFGSLKIKIKCSSNSAKKIYNLGENAKMSPQLPNKKKQQYSSS
jgi:hypothetical protein